MVECVERRFAAPLERVDNDSIYAARTTFNIAVALSLRRVLHSRSPTAGRLAPGDAQISSVGGNPSAQNRAGGFTPPGGRSRPRMGPDRRNTKPRKERLRDDGPPPRHVSVSPPLPHGWGQNAGSQRKQFSRRWRNAAPPPVAACQLPATRPGEKFDRRGKSRNAGRPISGLTGSLLQIAPTVKRPPGTRDLPTIAWRWARMMTPTAQPTNCLAASNSRRSEWRRSSSSALRRETSPFSAIDRSQPALEPAQVCVTFGRRSVARHPMQAGDNSDLRGEKPWTHSKPPWN
jgi:hypothetical protein